MIILVVGEGSIDIMGVDICLALVFGFQWEEVVNETEYEVCGGVAGTVRYEDEAEYLGK